VAWVANLPVEYEGSATDLTLKKWGFIKKSYWERYLAQSECFIKFIVADGIFLAQSKAAPSSLPTRRSSPRLVSKYAYAWRHVRY